MLKNYFKIAWRNLTRNKSFAVINILGLTLGFTCSILIFLFIRYHLSFDNFHEYSDRIYRIVTDEHMEKIYNDPSVPPALGKAFREDYDYAEKIARIVTQEEQVLKVSRNGISQKHSEEVAFAEQDFFDIFNYPQVTGTSFDFLSEPNTAMVSRNMARKLFGTEDPLGQTFELDNRIQLTVRAVMEDLPANTLRQTEIYISYPTVKEFGGFVAQDGWNGITSSLQCFTLLKPNIQPSLVESELQKYVAKYRANSKNVHHYKLQPLNEIHYDTRYDGVISSQTLIIFGIIGLFLMIAACINFVNLATAQSIGRSREVGVQKVLGGHRWQLFRRSILETGLLSFFSLIIGLFLAFICLPYLNQWFDVQISADEIFAPDSTRYIMALFVCITLLAGMYPGLLLSRVIPTHALKGKLTQNHFGGLLTRRSLIITQFVISQILIVGMIVIGKQMYYALNTDLGFAKDAIITVEIPNSIDNNKRNDLKNRMLAIPGVEKVTACYAPPAFNEGWSTNFSFRFGSHPESQDFHIQVKAADRDYLETFDLQLVAGRNFFPSGSPKEFLINETVVKKLNLNSPDEAIGESFRVNGESGTIVGVIADFHNKDLRSEIGPIFISDLEYAFRHFSVKINMHGAQQTIDQIGDQWNVSFPNYIFDYEFLDEHIARFYEAELRTFKLIQIFTFLAIFISCLGMFGVISYLVSSRTKEVGVRKVLGGSIAHVLWLFLNDFFKLVIIAGILAIPVSWLAMERWLQNFEYKIDLGYWIFGLAIASSLVITLFTVGFQSLRAALTNPAEVLRSE